ncbi:hypothetical protein ABS71_13530 [bacterium SCN 62-11]|nr:MAG: hypothetical protein ABS71_13530 [bacterium SCN 62-11]
MTAETLLWGIRDRPAGAKLAEDLSSQVSDKFSKGQMPVTAAVQQLSARFEARGLSHHQSNTALMVAGALLSGAGAAALSGLDAAQLDKIAEKAAKAGQTQAGQLLDDLSHKVDRGLIQQGIPAAHLADGMFLAGSLRQEQVKTEMAAWANDSHNPQSGLACGSFLRPEALFNAKTQTVVCTAKSYANPTGLEEVKVGKLQVVNMDQFMRGKNEVLIGFGKPNVFTLIPPAAGSGKDAYNKLDAFMFYRKKTRVTTASVAQSGVFLRPRNLPAEAVEIMRTAMQAQEGKRGISCAKTNATMLTESGFTSGGKKLSGEFRPQRLFMHIIENGLEYKGQKVQFDVLNTTPGTIEEHFKAVLKKERSSPIRAIEKIFKKDEKSEGEMSALKTAKQLKATDNLEVPVLGGAPIRIRNSRPAESMAGLRQYWGQHILWEALPDKSRVDVDSYLPEVLQDKFSMAKEKGQKLSTVDKLKNVAFSRPMVSKIRKRLAKHFDEMGEYQPGQIKAMIPVADPGKPPIMFNVVICGPKSESRVSITRIDGGKKAADWVLSKHVLISGYDPDVRFAGEIWAERFTAADGSEQTRLHINNNSGTYKPSDEQVKNAAAYLRELFPGVEIVGHAMGEEPPKATTPDHQKTFAVSPQQFSQLQESLDGKKLTLTDKSGKAQDYKIRHFKNVELDTEYLDTPDQKLLQAGGLLRARSQFAKDGRVKDIELEAKVPTQGGTTRVKGASYDNEHDWSAGRAEVLAGKDDGAVQLARYAAGKEAEFLPVAWKNTQRQLYLVSPQKPLGTGLLQPSFVVSLDTSSMRTQAEKGEGQSPSWHVLEPQVFTKLPWTKTVTTQRLEQFDDLCAQLAASEGLQPSGEAGYADAMKHLPKK